MEAQFTGIEIQNFRLYRENQKASLDGNNAGGNSFNLMVGYEPEILGGVGKSTFLKAVSICLRGGPYQSIGKWNLVNEKSVDNLSDGERSDGKITVGLSLGDTSYRFIRKVYTERENGNFNNGIERLSVKQKKDGSWTRVGDRVKQLLPESADEYCLVHPEYVSGFEMTCEHIETLIEKVIETQETLADHEGESFESGKEEVWDQVLEDTKTYFERFSTKDISIVSDQKYSIKFEKQEIKTSYHSEDSANNLLAFCILLATGAVGPISMPQIFDSPFIWLDNETRRKIYEALPETDNQVTVIASEGTIPDDLETETTNSYWLKLERGDYSQTSIESME
ncbi:MAG: hypothetical protein ABEK59_05720 [Halobacteria archaeon]